MKARMLLILSVVGLLLGSCDNKNVEVSQRALDSLRTQLAINQKMNQTLEELGTLIDSIDVNRNMIRTRMLEGATHESYVARMRDINDYVRQTERKLKALQRSAKKSNDPALKAAVKRMKSDLEARNQELAALKEQVAYYQKENEGLVQTVSTQRAEIDRKLTELKASQEATQQLEQQVSQLLTQSKIDQGEALYAQALAIEETANRTKFAPKKKKNTRRQAIELYKQALANGKVEAQDRIAALEKKL